MTEFVLGLDAPALEPGKIATYCVVVPVGNTSRLHVGGARLTRSTPEDLLVVYRTTAKTPQAEPFDCTNDPPWKDGGTDRPLLASGSESETLEFPDGVGITFEPGELVRIQLNAFNRDASALPVNASVTLVPMDDADYREELSLTWFTAVDSLPPSVSSYQWVMPPVPALSAGRLLGIAGHVRVGLTGATVEMAADATSLGTPLYAATTSPGAAASWLEPPGRLWTDVEGLRFGCEWLPNSNTSLGPQLYPEWNVHCLFWTYHTAPAAPMGCVFVGGPGTNLCSP